ncbi:MAG: orotate phosphoribosyltransferase [Verrucomicrobiota bacterium]
MKTSTVLRLFRKTGALLEGHFILRSGLHSRKYFQCALLLQYPSIASRVCKALAQEVSKMDFDNVISPALGGILVGQEVARHLKKRHIFTEKDNGVLKMRRFSIQPGERFLVAEDVVTTGSAVQETCRIVREAGGIVVGVGVIVDRSGDRNPDFGAPFISLVKINVETYSPDALPEDLQKIPVVKPGSK